MPTAEINVTASPHIKRGKLFTEVPSKSKNAGNPNSYEYCLIFISCKKPYSYAEKKTKK